VNTGYVSDCYKGYSDEIQNALLETYSLHNQEFPLPITKPMLRVVTNKIICSLTGILIRLAQSDYRGEVKTALRAPNWGFRKKTAFSVLFANLLNLRIDDYKYAAFQFGQAIGLIIGKEFYTKKSIAEYFLDLEPFIYRNKEKNNGSIIYFRFIQK